jgi:DNA-binding transcriptional LysR family regulator
LADGSLIRLLKEFEPEPLPVHLVTVSRSLLAPKLRAFLDLAMKIFRHVEIR